MCNTNNAAPEKPICLLTNELAAPLNTEKPRFSWVVNDSSINAVQSAYQIIVEDGITGEEVWDSGRVISSEQSNISCGGRLRDAYPYVWKVRTWNGGGEMSEYSGEAAFATGISGIWRNLTWINDGSGGGDAPECTHNHFWYARGTSELKMNKPVKKALAYIAAAHDYALYINGKKIGRGQSFDYAEETRYQCFDITDAIGGASKLTAALLIRTYGGGQGRAAADANLLVYINVIYSDGNAEMFETNTDDWKVLSADDLYYNTGGKPEIRNGEGDFVEKYDAAYERDFASPDYDMSRWNNAVAGTSVTNLIPELSKVVGFDTKPVSAVTIEDKYTVFDFGKIIPARFTLKLKGLIPAEEYTIYASYKLTSDGLVDKNFRSSASQETDMRFVYKAGGSSGEFSSWDHLGFQYIEVPVPNLSVDDITAHVIHTEVSAGRESTLETSNEILNKVYKLMKRSALCSVQNEFVDTPTREKGQFLDDAHNISMATMTAYMERETSRKAIIQFLASADRYWRDTDGKLTGRFNAVYPNGDGKRDIPEYSIDMAAWVWNYYMQTADRELLEAAYPYMKAVGEYITKHISSETGLVTRLDGGWNTYREGEKQSYGGYTFGIVDWPVSGRFGYDWEGTLNGARTTINMLSVRAFNSLSNMAEELGYKEEATEYSAKSTALTENINKRLINSEGLYSDGLDENGNMVKNTAQHSTSYALAFGVADGCESYDKMAEHIAAMGMRQGPMTAHILVDALFKSDKADEALKLLTNENDYGWADILKKGGTFIWEEWIADISKNSMSHGWGAAALQLILENIAGVKVTKPGASEIKIAPAHIDLTSMKASVATERGNVGVEYKKDGGSFEMTVTVPANVKAVIELPQINGGKFKEKDGNAVLALTNTPKAKYKATVGGGTYTFIYNEE